MIFLFLFQHLPNDPLLMSNHADNNNKKQTKVELHMNSSGGSGRGGANNHIISSTSSRDPMMSSSAESNERTIRCFRAECNCFIAYLLLGMLGFIAFWSILMLRIYLPEKYWEWSYIWS